MSSELTILGAGSWGTALAIALAPRFDRLHLWSHSAAAALESSRENATYLPGLLLPPNVLVSADFVASSWILTAVPSRHLRSTLRHLRPPYPVHVVSATKGIEAVSHLRMTQIIEAEWPTLAVAALSGPTFAREVASGLPAAIVIASEKESFATAFQSRCSVAPLRFYTNSDLRGVELAGALKNPIAIAAGAVEGLGLGANSMAALITRGLAEIGRLIEASGGRASTVSGLAGLGDLVLTCTGHLSRNRRIGLELAKGRPLTAILADSPMVAEGVETTPVALDLAQSLHVELPIISAVQQMLLGHPPLDLLRRLLDRSPKAEV